jgi:hypothetical protein
MARSLLKSLLATAAAVTLSVGVVGAASAAPVTNIVAGNTAQATASHGMIQSVHWVRRGHHRVWVPDHPVHHH